MAASYSADPAFSAAGTGTGIADWETLAAPAGLPVAQQLFADNSAAVQAVEAGNSSTVTLRAGSWEVTYGRLQLMSFGNHSFFVLAYSEKGHGGRL